jgi:hypothetical protein
MIRSCRIPSVLSRICTDNVIQTALLVTTDGELLGSTATTFLSPDGTTKESIESLGTLIADIAVDYGRLGEEYANLDPGGIVPPNAVVDVAAGTTGGASLSSSGNNSISSSSVAKGQQQPLSAQQQAQQQALPTPGKRSHMQCLLLELELGLVAVSACVGVDCMVIAICAPSAPLGTVRARLQAITAHVQENLTPLAMTQGPPLSYR